MKPSIPKGTRDFSPLEMVRRNYIFTTIRQVFQLHGFLPIETPSMENLSTLMGKYGDEGDQLIFKILNSGDYLSKIDAAQLSVESAKSLTPKISEKALRYDLTVPFARYVVMHQNEITFPFKRYQIQPVWRADRPQKGRYREFYQCDADIIGSNSLLNEIELIQIFESVFSNLKIPATIKINNRKILSGIAEVIGEKDKIIDITVAIDKLDKIGIEKVNEELKGKGLSDTAIVQLQPIIGLKGGIKEKLNLLKGILGASEIGLKGIEELEYIFSYHEKLGALNAHNDLLTTTLEFDITLARGLNYYTGAIFEVKPVNTLFTGSICGGGRYDDLTGIFGLPDVSGVGISFGADRIYDVMEELTIFPEETGATTKVLFVNFGFQEEQFCMPLLFKLRAAGINAEIYPEAAKMKKQMAYADAKKIAFVVLVGETEMNTGMLTLKNMSTGEQQKVSCEDLVVFCK
jgi:histidyl-tRNA synthetase